MTEGCIKDKTTGDEILAILHPTNTDTPTLQERFGVRTWSNGTIVATTYDSATAQILGMNDNSELFT